MSPSARVAWLTGRRAARQWMSTRTVVALPLLLLAIPGSAWGLSDPNTTLPADIPLDTPMQMLFVSSLFVLLTATLSAVLYAWDGVSRDRASGVLEVHLGRGMGRRGQATVIAASHLMVTTLPVLLLAMVAVFIIRIRTGAWASLGDSVVFLGSTALVVTWYTSIALLASSYARDQGTAIAFDCLDKDQSGFVEIHDIADLYDTSRNKQVLSGSKTEKEVLQNFLNNFEGNFTIKGYNDGKITRDEFLDYYGFISANYDNDETFVLFAIVIVKARWWWEH